MTRERVNQPPQREDAWVSPETAVKAAGQKYGELISSAIITRTFDPNFKLSGAEIEGIKGFLRSLPLEGDGTTSKASFIERAKEIGVEIE
ncbi:MAG: hypothetical protein NTY61_03145 [Candidatus Parcubacteria bacterium]|nr:hypothetical protein [Candidatus Parcubacteria bacterium]